MLPIPPPVIAEKDMHSTGFTVIRFVSSESLPLFCPANRYTRLLLPYSGSLGHRFPTFTVPELRHHRYYDPLRLPKALLRVVRCSLSDHDTLPALLLLCFQTADSFEWRGFQTQAPGVLGKELLTLSEQGDNWISRVPGLPP